MVNPIGWCDKTINCVVGCPHQCSYCYARRQAKRFLHRCKLCYDFVPHPHLERLNQLSPRQKPMKVFMDSMWDWNAKGVLDEWITPQIAKMVECKQHTFQILSKRPIRYSRFTYPENVWLGTSLCERMDQYVIGDLERAAPDNLKFLSIEPILGRMELESLPHFGIDWVIVGFQTNPFKKIEKEAVVDIIEFTRKKNIPLFLKDSIYRGYPDLPVMREFPNGR